jgi:hypothetical protein
MRLMFECRGVYDSHGNSHVLNLFELFANEEIPAQDIDHTDHDHVRARFFLQECRV